MSLLNRRTFLTSASTAALVATGGLGTSRKLFGQSSQPNLSLYNASASAHAIASGDAMVTGVVANDWNVVGNSLKPVLADWKANSLDAQLQPLLSRMTPSMVYPSNITSAQIQQIVQSVQVFQPNYEASHLQASLNFLSTQSGTQIAEVLSVVQSSSGLAYYINSLSLNAPRFAAYFAGGGPDASKALWRTVNPDATCLPCQPGGGDGGGGWSCAKDGAALAAAATAFLILTIMSGGILGIEGVLLLPWWAGVAGWGSVATGGWTAGHYAAGCSF